MKADKTTKVFEHTLDILRRLVKDDKEGLTQAQIIHQAVVAYVGYTAKSEYVYCATGIAGVGDRVNVNGDELVIDAITDDEVMFTDRTKIYRHSRLCYNMKELSN